MGRGVGGRGGHVRSRAGDCDTRSAAQKEILAPVRHTGRVSEDTRKPSGVTRSPNVARFNVWPRGGIIPVSPSRARDPGRKKHIFAVAPDAGSF
jgi:hypothetical protein